MYTAPRPLLDLTAGDLMSRTLVLVPEEMSLQAAARLLSQAQVSGAPVVNEAGRCVGVLSATDFVQLTWQGPAEGAEGEEAVRRYMTPDPVMVSADTSVGELARMMVDAHIHRVVVADEAGRPVGVVSSMDLLAALARAAAGQGLALAHA